MAIDPTALREQLCLADDELQISPQDMCTLGVNDRYHDLLDPYAHRLSSMMVGQAVRYFEVGPQFTADRSSFQALIAPQSRFEKDPAEPESGYDLANRWRLVTVQRNPGEGSRPGLRKQSSFVIDRIPGGVPKLTWEAQSQYTVPDKQGNPVWLFKAGSLPNLERDPQTRAMQTAKLIVRLSSGREKKLGTPSIDVTAALALSVALDRFDDTFEVPIESLAFPRHA